VKIAVYTSITSGKDVLKTPAHRDGIDLVFFTDRPHRDRDSDWNIRPACGLFTDPRRNSRAPKILAHQYLADYDYSLWLDGSMRLLVPVRPLIDEFLADADIATFAHAERDCIYEEAAVCAQRNLDDVRVIAEQMDRYRSDRVSPHPLHHGLSECGVILRRHTKQIEAFNNAWWSEFCRHSCRDQLSFNFVLRSHEIRHATFPGTLWKDSGIVVYEGHAR